MPLLAMVPRRPHLSFPLLMASVGCGLAQGCLLAAWLAWSDQPIGQRLLRHWIIAAILYLVWTAGLAFGLPDRFALASSAVGLSAPLVSLAAQLPLWLARQSFGWRLIRTDADNDTGAKPLTIRDLMLSTMLFASALALARGVPSPDGKETGTPEFVLFVAAATISTITLLPASLLLPERRRFHRRVLIGCVYAAFWMALPWAIAVTAQHRGLFAAPPVPVLAGLSCLVLSFATTVMLAAAVARACGYSLASGRQPCHSGGIREDDRRAG
jgi:hypothetical protein